jgi:hypothetical protein
MQEDSGPRLAQAKAWPYLKKKKTKAKRAKRPLA